MSEWLLIPVLIVGSAALACWKTDLCRRLTRQRERLAELCLVLLGLIQELQMHRGLSGALLDRRERFRADLEASDYKLQRSFQALTEQQRDRQAVFGDERWQGLLERWEALRSNWRGLGFETNIHAHGEVIRDLIGVLQDLTAGHPRVFSAAEARWIGDRAALIEDLGLLRALGLHLLGHPPSNADTLLVDEIASRINAGRARLHRITETETERALIVRTERGLRRVSWLLEGNAERYHPYTFYEEMTAVIDDWYRRIGQRLQAEPQAASLARRLITFLRPQLKTG